MVRGPLPHPKARWWRSPATRQLVGALQSPDDSYATELIRFTLCNKLRSEVAEMVIGPGKFVCDECAELCVEILEEKRGRSGRGGSSWLTKTQWKPCR